jgi:hypothetical protein
MLWGNVFAGGKHDDAGDWVEMLLNGLALRATP